MKVNREMKNRLVIWKISIGATFCFCILGCASRVLINTPTTAEIFDIPRDELTALEATAENIRSPQQARQIADYYTFVDFNPSKAEKWFKIAAEKGDTSAQSTVRNLYSKE